MPLPLLLSLWPPLPQLLSLRPPLPAATLSDDAATRRSSLCGERRSPWANDNLLRRTTTALIPSSPSPPQSSVGTFSHPRRRGPPPAHFQRNGIDISDRVIAATCYLLPFCDGLRYARFFFLEFPSFAIVVAPFAPVVKLFYAFPLAGFVAFLAIQLGVTNNQNLSRFVRFNAMQAVLLDIVLILPGLITSAFGGGMGSGAGLQAEVVLYNTAWLFTVACVFAGMGSAILGQTARLPVVGEAAEMQTR